MQIQGTFQTGAFVLKDKDKDKDKDRESSQQPHVLTKELSMPTMTPEHRLLALQVSYAPKA